MDCVIQWIIYIVCVRNYRWIVVELIVFRCGELRSEHAYTLSCKLKWVKSLKLLVMELYVVTQAVTVKNWRRKYSLCEQFEHEPSSSWNSERKKIIKDIQIENAVFECFSKSISNYSTEIDRRKKPYEKSDTSSSKGVHVECVNGLHHGVLCRTHRLQFTSARKI